MHVPQRALPLNLNFYDFLRFVLAGIRSSGGHLHRQALDRGRLQAQKGFGADTGKTKVAFYCSADAEKPRQL